MYHYVQDLKTSNRPKGEGNQVGEKWIQNGMEWNGKGFFNRWYLMSNFVELLVANRYTPPAINP